MNVNADTDRAWATKGSFAELFDRHRELLDAALADRARMQKRLRDHCFSGLVGALSKVCPLAKVVDPSPFDRAMRRVHNYMKETEEFRNDLTNYRAIRFPPLSAWMVFTDSVSHAILSGQHCLVPPENCRARELSPNHILEKAS